MTKQDVIRKLTSRKFWLSIASFISMLLVATGHAESEATQVAALIMAGATVIGYAVAEGLADAGHSDGVNPVVDDVEPCIGFAVPTDEEE